MTINVAKSDLPNLTDYVEYLKAIWESGHLTNNGPFLQLLEQKVAEYLDVKNILITTNGTLALQLTIKSLDLYGDVLTTPFTFAATTNVLVWEGLNPVFVDIDKDTYNISPREIEKRITKHTTAILGVHVYGNPCAVEEIQHIADKYSLKVVYDAAHAFGVRYNNTSVLNYGDASILSFHATKVFNTIEGGAIVVKDDALFEKLKLMRNFGIRTETDIVLPGINAKMNEFQAAMGLCNLGSVDTNIAARKVIYDRYKSHLDDRIQFQKVVASTYNYAYMPICFNSKEQRDAVCNRLLHHGVKARKYFCPLTSNFRFTTGKSTHLEVANDVADRVLCLPLYADLNMDAVDSIADVINTEVSV